MVPLQSAMAVMIARLHTGLAVARDEEGAQLAEYMLLVSLIAIVAMAGARQLGGVVNVFYQVSNAVW